MIKLKLLSTLAVILLGGYHTISAQTTPSGSTEIRLKLSPTLSDTALSGRVYVMLDRNVYAQPLHSEMPDESSIWLAVDVDNWIPGTDFTMAGDISAYPCSLAELPAGDYAAQAVFDVNTTERSFSDAPGNIFSNAVAASIRSSGNNFIDISLEHEVEVGAVHETGFIKEVRLGSRLLSDFLGRPTSVKAMVVLPPSYFHTPEQEYATVFVMPGFGSPYTEILRGDFQLHRYGMNSVGREKIFVFLDQECPLGYHGFADSENNGPWAGALFEEFIPHLEKTFRMYRDPSARFLTGQSSGAWAGLWLQLNYPEEFGGVWACSPDPVDFEAFMGVNIYKPNANLLFDSTGAPIELNKFLSDVDRVVGDGWVMSTFEAVFSPRGEDGRPLRLWNRETGEIDARVAATWRKYDLRLILQNNWNELAPKLAGKIHILVADNDSFGLDVPVKSLQQAMAGVNHDMEVVILDEGAHDLWTGELRRRLHQDMDDRIARNHPAP